jgi:hypothetical protein
MPLVVAEAQLRAGIGVLAAGRSPGCPQASCAGRSSRSVRPPRRRRGPARSWVVPEGGDQVDHGEDGLRQGPMWPAPGRITRAPSVRWAAGAHIGPRVPVRCSTSVGAGPSRAADGCPPNQALRPGHGPLAGWPPTAPTSATTAGTTGHPPRAAPACPGSRPAPRVTLEAASSASRCSWLEPQG